eukprot:7376511-Prymnesium_polylepis.1
MTCLAAAGSSGAGGGAMRSMALSSRRGLRESSARSAGRWRSIQQSVGAACASATSSSSCRAAAGQPSASQWCRKTCERPSGSATGR